MRRMNSWLCSLLLAGALVDAAASTAATNVYSWKPEQSELMVLTDRAGFFGRMGHRHKIRAQQFAGSVEWDPALPEGTRIDLIIDAKSLKVIDDDLNADDVVKVQRDMEAKVLEVEKHPEIRFLSNGAAVQESSEGKWTLNMSGSLLLHGVSQAAIVPLTMEMHENVLHLRGETTVRQKDYDIEPVSVGMGAVKVKNEVKITFNLLAEAPPAPTAADSTSSPDAPSSEPGAVEPSGDAR